ncbi:MAG: hypothetical protein AB1505_27965, partial [Candidatus Latescibacterota bacterium]
LRVERRGGKLLVDVEPLTWAGRDRLRAGRDPVRVEVLVRGSLTLPPPAGEPVFRGLAGTGSW